MNRLPANMIPKTLVDAYGRSARYLRVSLTDACNYRCAFCVPPGAPVRGGGARLTCEEMLRLCAAFASLGVDRFKITGGEPFMNPDAMRFIAGLKSAAGAPDVTVTTNGSTLDRHAAALAVAGVVGVNVSVNAMTQAGYERVTGAAFSLRRVLDGIVLAKESGLRVKLNMVPLRGMNEDAVLPLLEFALPLGIPVRFIELMPIGQGRRCGGLPSEEVRAIIESRFGAMTARLEPAETGKIGEAGKARKAVKAAERFGNGPAEYFSLSGFAAEVGFIAPVSRRFCASCDRLRLSGAGFLRTCLHHGHGADLAPLLRGASGLPEPEGAERLARRIREAVLEKPEGHFFVRDIFNPEPMHRIGG